MGIAVRFAHWYRWVLLVLVTVALWSGCRKSRSSPQPRPQVEGDGGLAKGTLQGLLTSSPKGWLVCLANEGGARYNFHMRFHPNGRVDMRAAFDQESLSPKQSAFRIKALKTPTLSFSTYNYISELADPDLYNIREGLRTDFEYESPNGFVEGLRGDLTAVTSFSLKGILYGTKASFVRVVTDEQHTFLWTMPSQWSSFLRTYTKARKSMASPFLRLN